jgi:hypothetical protein
MTSSQKILPKPVLLASKQVVQNQTKKQLLPIFQEIAEGKKQADFQNYKAKSTNLFKVKGRISQKRDDLIRQKLPQIKSVL